MNNFFNTIKTFLAPPVFEGDEEKTRGAELVNTMLLTQIGIFTLALLALPFSGNLPEISSFIVGFVFLGFQLFLLFMLRRGYVVGTGTTLLVILTLMVGFDMASAGTIRQPTLAMLILASIFAGLAMGRPAAIVSVVINSLLVIIIGFAEINGLLPPPELATNTQHIVIFAAAGVLTVVLLNQALRRIDTALNTLTELNVGLEQRVIERTRALETSAEISHRLTTILDPRDLAKAVVTEVQSVYDYYYAQIYLFDETGENLVLTSGTGEAGAEMMKRGHSLSKGRGLVGRAAESNESILVSDTSQDPNWLPNELLPDTKAEAVVPISIGDQVFGVLDVQDDVTNDITPEDITLLESLAGQVAISLQNAESYARAEAALQEAKSLVEYAAEGIAVLDLTTGLFTESNKNAEKLYGLDHEELLKVGPAQMSPPTQPDGRDSTEAAMEKIGIAMEKGDATFDWVHINAQGNAFPCEIRLVRLPGDHPRIRVSIFDITERKNLQEFTAQRARQQEAINTITQRIQSATTIEEAMQVAARELGHALGQKQTVVALEPSAFGDNGNK